ncbi:MAG: hypothetical protein R3Y28_05730 [Candidatus Gastranaerophilales bacterium]
MGLITATIRMQYLQQSRLDLEYKLQLITQTKMGLLKSVDDLLEVGNDYDPESPATKMLNQRQAKLKALEQKLDAQQLQYNTRLKMIEAEYQSAKSMFESNVATVGYYNM